MSRTFLAIFLVAQGLVLYAQSDAPKPAYDFSLSREERIKLAESAAPPEISSNATVYLLERGGYLKVRDGSNGFSCFVDRQNPLNLEPTCFDAEGSATTLLSRFYAEEQRAKGKSEEEIKAGIEEGYKTGKFQAPRKPGIVYMMSDKGCLLVPGNKLVHLPPHLMFYAPYATDKDIGAPPAAANMPHPDSRGATRRGRDRVSESRGPLRLEGAHNCRSCALKQRADSRRRWRRKSKVQARRPGEGTQ